MKKIILAITTIFALNLSALDIRNILIEVSNNESYERSCLSFGYSDNFCAFSASLAILLNDMANMQNANVNSKTQEVYMRRVMGKYTCPAYRDLATIEQHQVEELYYGNIAVGISKQEFDSMCY